MNVSVNPFGRCGALEAEPGPSGVAGLVVWPVLFAMDFKGAADADMAPPSHYAGVFTLLDGGLRDGGWMGEGRPKGGHALAILPGLTHYDICTSPLLAAVTISFLDG